MSKIIFDYEIKTQKNKNGTFSIYAEIKDTWLNKIKYDILFFIVWVKHLIRLLLK